MLRFTQIYSVVVGFGQLILDLRPGVAKKGCIPVRRFNLSDVQAIMKTPYRNDGAGSY